MYSEASLAITTSPNPTCFFVFFHFVHACQASQDHMEGPFSRSAPGIIIKVLCVCVCVCVCACVCMSYNCTTHTIIHQERVIVLANNKCIKNGLCVCAHVRFVCVDRKQCMSIIVKGQIEYIDMGTIRVSKLVRIHVVVDIGLHFSVFHNLHNYCKNM